MNNRIPPLLLGVIGLLVIAVLALGFDRMTRITEADLIATVEHKIALAGTNADIPALLAAQSTQLSEQDSLIETQIAQDAAQRKANLQADIASAVSSSSDNLETQIAIVITEEQILETVDAQGVDVLTQVAEFYPSDTPTATATLTPSNTPTTTSTSTPTTTPTFTPTPTATASRTPIAITSLSVLIDAEVWSSEFAISPDGLYVAYGIYYKLIIQSLETMEVVRELPSSGGSMNSVVWSPDGRYIVGGGVNNNIFVWDIFTADIIFQQNHGEDITSIDWSPDSTRIVVASESKLTSWVISENRLAREYTTQSINTVDWSPSNDLILVGSQFGADQFGVTSNVVVRRNPGSRSIESLVLPMSSVRISPDGSWLATLTESGLLTIYDADSLKVTSVMGQEFEVGIDLTWSPDSNYLLAIVDNNMLLVWDVHTYEQVVSTSIGTSSIRDSQWLLQGDKILLLTDDGISQIDVPPALSIQPLDDLPMPFLLPTLTPSPTPTASSTPTETNTPSPSLTPTDTATPTLPPTASRTPASLASGRLLSSSYYSAFALDVSPYGEFLAIGDYSNNMYIMSLDTGREIKSLSGGFDTMWGIDWSPDGQYIAAGGFGEEFYIWDVSSGELIVREGVFDYINAVEWSPDGQYVAISTNEKTSIWDFAEAEFVADRSTSAESLSWSPDSSALLVTGYDGFYTYLVAEGLLLSPHKISNAGFDSLASFAPDGDTYAFIDDATVSVYNSQSNRMIWQVRALIGDPNSLFWSPDGLYIGVVTDAELSIWDAQTAEKLYTARFSDTMYSGTWTLDGGSILTLDGQIYVWNIPSNLNIQPSDSIIESAPTPTRTPIQHLSFPTRTPTVVPDASISDLEAINTEYVASFDIAVSPDGEQYAYTDEDDVLTIASVSTGDVIETFGYAGSGVPYIRWSPDGHYIAADDEDEVVRVWDVNTGEVVFEQKADDVLIKYKFSADSQNLAMAGDGIVTLWSIADGELISTHTEPSIALDFSSDGELVAVGSFERLSTFTIDDNEFVLQNEFEGLDSYAIYVTVSPNNQWLAAVDIDGNVAVWDIHTTDLLWNSNFDVEFTEGLWWSPDSQYLMSIADVALSIFDGQTGDSLYKLDTEGNVFSARWLPSGEGILTLDVRTRFLPLPDNLEIGDVANASTPDPTATSTPAPTIEPEQIDGVAFGKTLDVGIIGSVGPLAWSPNGEMIVATNSREHTLTNVETGEIASIELEHDELFWKLAWSPDSTLVAFGAIDSQIIIYNVVTQQEMTRFKTGSIERIDFSLNWINDGQHLAIHYRDNLVIWDIENEQIRTSLLIPVDLVAWSPDSSQVLVFYETTMTLLNWSSTTAKFSEVYSIEIENPFYAYWSTHDNVVIINPTGPGNILLRNPDDGSFIAEMPHDSYKMAFATERNLMATVGTVPANHIVEVWNMETLENVFTSLNYGNWGGVAWNPDGTQFAIEGQNGAYLWTFDDDFLAGLE